MKNILLLTDFSENSWNSINYAIQFFEKEVCNFYLLYVNRLSDNFMDGSPYLASQDVLEDVYTKPSKQKLRKVLRRIANNFEANKNHRFYSLSDFDFFIESIRRHVDEKKIDLIVMGTKGASGLKKSIIGSNAGDVITKVKCNTLVVPENAILSPLKEGVFPTDFSLTYDIKVLNPLLDIIEKSNAYLSILHICKRDLKLNTEEKRNSEFLDDYFNHINHGFHYITNTNIEEAIQFFTKNRNANMICMVAKNLNYFQQILFHSKVEDISYHTDIPFLVLHEKN